MADERFWVQLVVDILDPFVMPAVDSPTAGGLHLDQLRDLLAGLSPEACGVSVTVFDPDLEPTGSYAVALVDVLVDGLFGLRSAGLQSPDSRR